MVTLAWYVAAYAQEVKFWLGSGSTGARATGSSSAHLSHEDATLWASDAAGSVASGESLFRGDHPRNRDTVVGPDSIAISPGQSEIVSQAAQSGLRRRTQTAPRSGGSLIASDSCQAAEQDSSGRQAAPRGKAPLLHLPTLRLCGSFSLQVHISMMTKAKTCTH